MFWPHRLGSGLEPGVLASQTRLWAVSLLLWCHRLGPRDVFLCCGFTNLGLGGGDAETVTM